MTDLPNEVPVAVIGAGPTGLVTALLLASYGVRSVIFEKNAEPMDIPRAIVLDDEGARTLQVYGGDESFIPLCVLGDGAAYVDDNGTQFARVGTGPETYGFAKRHFINQPELETDMRAHVAASELTEIHFSTEVTDIVDGDDGATLSLTLPDGATATITAQYVVAADGGRSPTRERLGLEMRGSTYAQDWIVVDTLNDPDPANYSTFYCSNQRPYVRVPAPRGGKRYEFMLLPGETHEEVLADGFVEDLLRPFREIEAADIVRKTIYTFHARMAETWRVGRILLAGDAAHLTPPFAGQGMNAGLRDAANLSWKLAAVINGGASPNSLDSYGAERRDPAWAMIQLAVVMGDVVMPIDEDQLAFRAHLLKALEPFPAVQDYFLQMKFKPRPRFDTGLFLGLDDQPFEGSIVGEMIPQPDVSADGRNVKLDALLGAGFSLIAQDHAGAEALAALDQSTFAGMPLARVFVPWNGATGPVTAYETTDARMRPLRTHRDQILFIRPDRYAAAAFDPAELKDGLNAYLAHMS